MSKARECAQEIISAHVLAKNVRLRDSLIEEYVDELGADDLLRCVFDFVHAHAVADIAETVVESRFHFVLNLMGVLIEHVADETGESVHEITRGLALCTFEDADAARDTALKASQTCLIIHMLVRSGESPWGVQSNLNLADMVAVVQFLGDLMWTLVQDARAHVGDAFLIRSLLEGIHIILASIAHAHGIGVSQLVGLYWGHLALRDCDSD